MMVTLRAVGRHDRASVVVVSALGILVCGCSGSADSTSPTSPSGGSPQSAVRVTLAGSIYEYTYAGQRPLPGVGVRVWLTGNAPPDNTRDTVSDNNGRYVIGDALLPTSETWSVSISGETHVQPCGLAFGDYGTSGTTVDVHSVPAEALSVGGVPPTHPQSGAYGTVFEAAGNARISIPDAEVRLFTEDEVLATVRTDSQGRFGFCLVYDSAYGRRSWPFWVSVTKAGYRRSGFVVAQSSLLRKVDVQLVPEIQTAVR